METQPGSEAQFRHFLSWAASFCLRQQVHVPSFANLLVDSPLFRGTFRINQQQAARDVLVCTSSSSSSQCQWSLGTLGRSFFSTSSEESLVGKCRKNESAVLEAHEQLWPGLPVQTGKQAPSVRTGGQVATAYVPTSLMVSYVLHMSTSNARTAEHRSLAHGLFRALFDNAFATGKFQLDVLQYSEDLSSSTWVKQVLKRLSDFELVTEFLHEQRCCGVDFGFGEPTQALDRKCAATNPPS